MLRQLRSNFLTDFAKRYGAKPWSNTPKTLPKVNSKMYGMQQRFRDYSETTRMWKMQKVVKLSIRSEILGRTGSGNRPSSILPTLSKVYERIILWQMTEFISQSGCRKGQYISNQAQGRWYQSDEWIKVKLLSHFGRLLKSFWNSTLQDFDHQTASSKFFVKHYSWCLTLCATDTSMYNLRTNI